MTWVFGLFSGILGLVIGSFLNVVIYRLPEALLSADAESEFSFFSPGHSVCVHCRQRLKPWHNIPLLSFIYLKGRCAFCQTPISWRYPFIELLTALAFVGTFLFFGLSVTTVAGFIFISFGIALWAIDLKHCMLPDALTLPLVWLGLLLNTQGIFVSANTAIIGAIVGYISFWMLYWLFKLIRKKEALGYGDMKLFAALGAWFGWQALPFITLIACALTLLYALSMTLFKRASLHACIPFGPPLIIAGVLYLLG